MILLFLSLFLLMLLVVTKIRDRFIIFREVSVYVIIKQTLTALWFIVHIFH